MNLFHLSDEQLLKETHASVTNEREATITVLHHIREVERRRLFASLGYGSLFDYVTKELGYCPASACRRIDAMRLLKEIPEIENKVQEGTLSLSNIARAHRFFRHEEFEPEEKKSILLSLENKSTREAEKTLLSLSSNPVIHLPERVKLVTSEVSEVTFYADEKLLNELAQLKGLLGHSHPNMSMSELIAYLAELGLKKLNPAQKETRANESVAAPNPSVRQPSKKLVRDVWKRDGSKCTWKNLKTGEKCQSTHRLQVDHRVPFALGGKTTLENLRLLCFHHNQLEAEARFGRRRRPRGKAREFLRRLNTA